MQARGAAASISAAVSGGCAGGALAHSTRSFDAGEDVAEKLRAAFGELEDAAKAAVGLRARLTG